MTSTVKGEFEHKFSRMTFSLSFVLGPKSRIMKIKDNMIIDKRGDNRLFR